MGILMIVLISAQQTGQQKRPLCLVLRLKMCVFSCLLQPPRLLSAATCSGNCGFQPPGTRRLCFYKLLGNVILSQGQKSNQDRHSHLESRLVLNSCSSYPQPPLCWDYGTQVCPTMPSLNKKLWPMPITLQQLRKGKITFDSNSGENSDRSFKF